MQEKWQIGSGFNNKSRKSPARLYRNMIIVRSPLRISIAGGGTDLRSWYREHGSMFISAAINKYVYITLQKRNYSKKINLRYSEIEEVDSVDEIKHEIIRETFRFCGVKDSIALTSHADIPAGTGLGSSGAFGVAVLHALHPKMSQLQLAYKATHVQMNLLNYPIGVQDQYATAIGGVNEFTVHKDGMVFHELMWVQGLERKLVMFYTGIKRDTNQILAQGGTEGLEEIQTLAYRAKDALEGQNFDDYGYLMHEHWIQKKKRGGISNQQIDVLYELGLENGALGGKLIGAGGGGFLLFYTNDRERLIKAMPLQYEPFKFDYEGSKIIYRDL